MGAARAAARSQAEPGWRDGRAVNANLYARLRAQVPGAARACIREPGGRALSYDDLDAESARYASALRELGVQPGDRVLAQAERSVDLILLYLGALRAGAVYVPLNPAYTLSELEHYIADAEPRVIVCAPDRLQALLPVAQRYGVAHVVTLGVAGQGGSLAARAAAQGTTGPDVERSDTDLAAIIYTSGTTGRSKGAMLTHGNLAANALALKDSWRFTTDDVLLHFLPLFHIHGLFVAVNVPLAAGASLIVLPAFTPAAVLAGLPGATVLMGVPTHYLRLLQDPRIDRRSLATVRVCISGSAPLLPETHREWLERTGRVILERYGMSETGMIASNPYDGERRPGSVGLPLPGVALRVVDAASGAPRRDGAVGMIEVSGPGVFPGYWRMPDRTRAEFRADGYFVTGDLGRFDADGYLHIVGRSKDLIITGGFNVYPREVEAEIDAIPGVAESAVFGVPHPDFGEGVSAAVVLKPGAAAATPVTRAGHEPPSEATILARLHERLAGYKCPKRVLFCAELPRNAMGKVQKNRLRDLHHDLYGVSKR
jgi:malonyl-CoA/methylmalonyl-CoA synthetase